MTDIAIADLEKLRETFIMGLEIRFIQYENGQISESQLNDNGGELHSKVKALSKAIDSLKCDKLARVRDYIESESHCGVLRSMSNTARSNAMKDVLGFIDKLDCSSGNKFRLVGECTWAHQKGFEDLDNINGKRYSTQCGVYNLELTGDYCCCGDLIRVEA